MKDKKKNGWIKFVPSLDLPNERVSIAYDTHDERGYRFAYGYFQFHNGTCGCFWKDGNEQPKVVKAEDIKYWMPVPPLEVQEEPVSDDLEKAAERDVCGVVNNCSAIGMPNDHIPSWVQDAMINEFIHGAKWKEEQMMEQAIEGVAIPDDCEVWCNLDSFNLKEGDKIKVIVIKED